MHFTELDTPALAIELDVLEKNIRDMQDDCDWLGIALRAHTKPHKTPEIARMQVSNGAIGIVCQKLGEAEAMAAGGLDDILIPYNIVGRPKLERLTRLIKRDKVTITVAADSLVTVEGLSQQAVADSCAIRVIVEMDCGYGRCGAQSPRETLELAQHIDRLPGLEFMGVMFYKGGDGLVSFLEEVRHLMKAAGLPLHIVSGGSTGGQARAKELGCTEGRAGTYAYSGMTHVKQDGLHPDRCPLRVVVTVVSTAHPGRIIVDAGQKAFTSYPPVPYGYCVEHPEISITRMHVEHGGVDISRSSHAFRVGEVLSFIPVHGGMTTNLYDRMHAVRDGEVVDTWEVAGRGKAQ